MVKMYTDTEPSSMEVKFVSRRLSWAEIIWLVFERRLVVTVKVYMPWMDDHTLERIRTDVTCDTRVSVPASDFKL